MVRGLPKGLVRALFETMLDAATGAGGPTPGKRGAARRRKGADDDRQQGNPAHERSLRRP